MSHETARRVLEAEARALNRLSESLSEDFGKAVAKMASCEGRVVVTGMGKSGLVGHKISATLASTGTPSFFLHPAEAFHGDLGMVKPEDVILALSNSGETEEIVRLVPFLKRLGACVVAATGSPASTLASLCDIHITVPIDEEGCPLNLAPMASTTAQLALGDALAAELMEKKRFQPEDFAQLHPGGKLGKRFMRVGELMHASDALPRVLPATCMKDVIYEISAKKLGLAVVAEEDGTIRGIITDGDMRRLLERHGGALLERKAADCANKNPQTISAGALAAEALRMMEERKITALLVPDEEGRIQGVIHLHDLWRLQLL